MTVIISPAFPAESEKDDGKANHRENEIRKRHDLEVPMDSAVVSQECTGFQQERWRWKAWATSFGESFRSERARLGSGASSERSAACSWRDGGLVACVPVSVKPGRAASGWMKPWNSIQTRYVASRSVLAGGGRTTYGHTLSPPSDFSAGPKRPRISTCSGRRPTSSSVSLRAAASVELSV